MLSASASRRRALSERRVPCGKRWGEMTISLRQAVRKGLERQPEALLGSPQIYRREVEVVPLPKAGGVVQSTPKAPFQIRKGHDNQDRGVP